MRVLRCLEMSTGTRYLTIQHRITSPNIAFEEFDAYDEDRSGYIDVKEGTSPVAGPTGSGPRNQEPNLSNGFCP